MVGIKSFPISRLQKDNFKDENLEAVQSNSESLWNSIRTHPLLTGRLITDIDVSATSTRVSHKLGRTPRGWFMVKCSTPIVIYSTGSDSKFLNITATGPDKVSLWVF